MTSDMWLVLIFGMLAGGALGYVTTWRFSRKLEHHGVKLADWDQPLDMKAPREPVRLIHSDEWKRS